VPKANRGVRSKKAAVPAAKVSKAGAKTLSLDYNSRAGVDAYARQLRMASPDQLMELERDGVPGSFITDLSERMNISRHRLFGALGMSKATAARKAAKSAKVAGASGYAAIGMAKLLGIAQELVANSTAEDAEGFDAAAWLGEWIEHPQPTLGGRKPSELLSTPTGLEVVARLLGSLESGAYQ
jgi:putative toxin-antitoxin system antitoxin component (TIGR02293 family)